MLAGPAGVGKGLVVESVVAMAGTDEVHRLRCGSMGDADRLRSLTQADARVTVVVSQAHLLSAEGIEALNELVARQHATVVATFSTSRHFIHDADSESLRAALWSHSGLERIDLTGVGIDEADQIIQHAAESIDTHLGLGTRARIIDAANGNPLVLRQLALELAEHDRSVGFEDFLFNSAALSPRLVDSLYPHIAGLTPQEGIALASLARIGRVPQQRAARLVGLANVRALAQYGLATVSGHGTTVQACRVYGLVYEARHPLPAGVLETGLIEEARSGQSLSDTECFVIANFWVNEPACEPVAALDRPQAAAIFEAASRQADLWGFDALTQEFASRSLALCKTVASATMLSRGIAAHGRFAEACAVLDDDALEHGSPVDDLEHVLWRASLAPLVPQAGSPREVLEKAREWQSIDDFIDRSAPLIALLSRADGTPIGTDIPLLNELASDEMLPLTVRVTALTTLLTTHAYRGEEDDLVNTIVRGRALLADLWSTEGHISRNTQKVAMVFLSEAAVVEAVTGVHRKQLEDKVMALSLRSAERADLLGLTLLDLVSGYMDFKAGKHVAAVASLENGVTLIQRTGHQRWGTSARCLLARALACAGQLDDAESVFRSIRPGSPGLLFTYDTDITRIALAHARGDADGARRLALAAAQEFAHKSRIAASLMLYFAYQLGEPAAALTDVIDGMTAPGSLPTTRAIEAHLRASAAGDARALRAAAEGYSELAFHAAAQLTYREAQALYVERLEFADAHECEQLAGGSDVESLPLAQDARPTLTRREAEIAMLASQKMTNAEIAKKLFLSVRTVESHILQARAKTGSASKAELANNWGRFAPR